MNSVRNVDGEKARGICFAKKFNDKPYNKMETKRKRINLCISKYCFLKCRGCYNNFCNLDEISFEAISNFLSYAKEIGLEKVTLSGGDPLARLDIDQIIEKCINLGLEVNLDTVGLPFIKNSYIVEKNMIIKKFEKISLLKKIKMIGIPLDGSSNGIISKFRIYNGNLYEETIKILKFFEQEKIDICINTVLHKENIKDIQNIFNILKKYSCIKKWQVFEYMPIGPLGKKNENIFKVDTKKFDQIRRFITFTNKTNINICFKSAKERSRDYMLVDSNGTAYKVDFNNDINIYGNVNDKETWDKILSNLY